MKVVLLKSGVKNAGGLEKTASRIAAGFQEHGANVSILTTAARHNSFDLTSIGIALHALKIPAWPSFFRIQQFDKQVQRWLQKNPADIVFGMDRNKHQTHIRAGNGVHAAYLKSRIATEGRFKYNVCLCNPLHRKILQIEKEAFEDPKLKKIFTNSHMVKREILNHYSVDLDKISVIHNGVEWEEMRSDFTSWPEQKREFCQLFHLDPDHFHLLFIGNGYLRKGLTPLLTALSLLQRKDVHLSIVGNDRHQDRYEALANMLGLRSQVRFFGSQTNIRPFYQFADVLAIPSFYDPFANVTVEALAMGLFVLSSKTNGGSEILTSQTGVIIDDLHSIESIAASLEQVLLHQKTAKSAQARRSSIEHLDYGKQIKQLIESCLA
jgi:UDP-glucose:(heptosyl)LPS alpha-1,3-glucosyltransferase